MTQSHEPPDLDPRKLLDAVVATRAGPADLAAIDLGAVADKLPGYEFLACIGRGGMGTVYKARDRRLGRPVAVKVLHPDLASDPGFALRFEREAKALAQLNHPHILTLYEFGEAQGLFYLVTEFVDGMSLSELQNMGRLSVEEALRLLPQICDALQFAHDHGVVHRDVKPGNILVDEAGRVRLADFGLAKLKQIEPGAVTLTQSQQVFGTLQYMAPEQMRGTADVDHRADIFSLGVLTYELLTGNLPVGRFAEPSKTDGVQATVNEAVMRSLESDPERRYQRVADFQRDLDSQRSVADTNSPGSAMAQFCWLPVWSLLWFAAAAAASLVFMLLFYDNRSPHIWGALLAVVPVWLGALGCVVAGIVAIVRIRKARGRLWGLGIAVLLAWGLPLYGLCSVVLVNLWLGPEHRTQFPMLLILCTLITTVAILVWQYETHAAAAFGKVPLWRRTQDRSAATVFAWYVGVAVLDLAALLQLSVIRDPEARTIAVTFAIPVLLGASFYFLRWRQRLLATSV